MHNATYGDLEDTLLALGYIVRTGVNEFGFPYNAYENSEYNSLILLQGASREEGLKPIDLLSAERSVTWKGVADNETFHDLLNKRNTSVTALAS